MSSMHRKIVDTLEWYAEASRQDVLEDNGERARKALMDMGSNGDPKDQDYLEELLECASTLVERLDRILPDLDGEESDSVREAQEKATTILMEWE